MDVTGALTYFGITPDKLTPFILFGLIFWWFFVRPGRDKLNKIAHSITEIQTILRGGGHNMVHLVEAPGSPLRPTEYGAGLIKESGLEKLLDTKREKLTSTLKEMLPEKFTPYDVQETARKLIVSKKNDPEFAVVKDYAYNKGLNVDLILNAGGLWLRDDFLGKKREIKRKV